MRVSPFATVAADTIRRCDDAHVVVDFVRLERENEDPVGRPLHQRAACAAVVDAYRRWEGSIDGSTTHALGRWGTRRLRARIERRRERTALVDPSTLDGRRIDAREFFGPGFIDGSLVSLVEWDRSDSLDFTYAVCQPPYGLQVGDAELEKLFGDIVEHVLGDPDVRTEIWSWDTAWSPYFDPGHEWWGTGLWTIDVQGSVVAILASATD